MIGKSLNRTNVIWSFNSAGLNEEHIEQIAESDVDSVRLVGLGSDVKEIVKNTKALKERFAAKGKTVPVLVDMQRVARCVISNLKEPITLTGDTTLSLTPPGKGGDLELECTDWESFFEKGVLVYLGNAAATLMPESIEKDLVRARIIQGGQVEPHMFAHCPLTRQPMRLEKDFLKDLYAYGESAVDGVIVPCLSTTEDMLQLKNELKKSSNSAPWIFIRIDTEVAFSKLKDFIPYIKGVLISRLELGMCMDPAKVPMMTKEIIQLCNNNAKIVMVASDILASMRHNATPTRAEVSDIANATLDGADGVVLSKELAMGKYASRGLNLAKMTIANIEAQPHFSSINWVKHSPTIDHTLAAVTYSAYRTAQRNKAKGLVCLTNKGNTALLLASFRSNIPILAVTFKEEVLRRLSLIRGVRGMLLNEAPNIDDVLPEINKYIVKKTWLESGDKIVFVSVSLSSIGEKASNLLTVQTLQ